MKSSIRTAAFAILLSLVAAGARAEETVTLSGMHLCCKGCTMAVEQAAAKVAGVTCETSQDDREATLTAESTELLQQAVNEIAKAGLMGAPDNDAIKIPEAKTEDGKVKVLEIKHIHNCCKPCNDEIAAAVESVEGVTGHTSEAKKSSFTVEGDFVAADVVKALVEAGFYGSTE